MTNKLHVTARVRLVLEVDVGDNWDPDSPCSQIHRQAGREITTRVDQILREAKLRVRLIGEPYVETLIIPTPKQG